jgi:ribosomal protein S18 acetylase RimI-like enzyme
VSRPVEPAESIGLAGAEKVDDLRELWLALHHHHQQTAALQPLVADDDLSWRRRRATYLAWLDSGEGLLLLATANERPIAYAMVHLQHGPDDTWPLGERYAELYSLSVAAGFRGQGIGSRLMDRVDQELEQLGIRDLQIAVMVGNGDAQRFYEHRGLQAGEITLYRFG